MPAGDQDQLARYADMLSAMGTEPRLRIVRLLLAAHPLGMVVGEIGDELSIPNSTLSHHLDKLKNEGLVTVTRQGVFLRYRANHAALQDLLAFLYAECCTRNPVVEPKTIALPNGTPMSDMKETVRTKYAEAATRVTETTCCGEKKACCGEESKTQLYDAAEIDSLPEKAVLASLGCGNPTALAELKPGEIVLDLGSGGGIDVLLSARRVGPTGKAYGLDMTDEMLALANDNKARSGLANVEFLKGEIEAIPLPDNSVDVIISNCVINLSGDKDKVLSEAFRVLKPGGRFAVSDIVVRGEVPAEIRQNMLLWAGCVSGALQDSEYTAKLKAVGFEYIGIEATQVYEAEVARDWFKNKGVDFDTVAPFIDKKFVSAFIRAVKPRPPCGCSNP